MSQYPPRLRINRQAFTKLDVLDNRNEGDLARFVGEEDEAPALNPQRLAFFIPSQTQILGFEARAHYGGEN